MAILETERLILRQWNENDFEHYSWYYADDNNARYVGGKKDKDQAWRLMALQIGHWQLKGFGYWAVDEKETSDFVGCVGLWQSPGWPELELGLLAHAGSPGKGLRIRSWSPVH